MNLSKKIKLLTLWLIMACPAIASTAQLNGNDELKNLEMVCPDCKTVAEDVLELRVKHCQLNDTSSAVLIHTVKNDPMFSFMLAVHTAAGTDIYKKVKSSAAENTDCNDSHNWVKLTQNTIKKGKAL